ncbi:MAG TPA: hypothetical protein VMW52_02060 [Phycisphaerae bacterium]|nr:hypothetical protein [Phycisphaerae bacterium]
MSSTSRSSASKPLRCTKQDDRNGRGAISGCTKIGGHTARCRVRPDAETVFAETAGLLAANGFRQGPLLEKALPSAEDPPPAEATLVTPAATTSRLPRKKPWNRKAAARPAAPAGPEAWKPAEDLADLPEENQRTYTRDQVEGALLELAAAAKIPHRQHPHGRAFWVAPDRMLLWSAETARMGIIRLTETTVAASAGAGR